jgi:hypothetical protein
MEERRKSPRVVVDVPARVTIGEQTIDGRVRDICRDAALVRVDRRYPLQTRAVLETELPKVSGAIRAAGSVVRVADSDDGTHGIAILFDELPPEVALRIELFVSDADR